MQALLKKVYLKYILPFLLFLLLSSVTLGQKNNSIGIDIALNNTFKSSTDLEYSTIKTYKAAVKFSFGVLYQRKISKRASIETGILLNQYETNHSYLIPTAGNSSARVSMNGRENFIDLHALYVRRIGIVNLSIGPVLNYFLHWRSEQPHNGYTIFTQDQLPGFWFPQKITLGVLSSLGYPIKIKSKFCLEPQLNYYSNFSIKQELVGVTVLTKYLF